MNGRLLFLLFIFGSSGAITSLVNAHPTISNSRFFQSWLLRVIDFQSEKNLVRSDTVPQNVPGILHRSNVIRKLFLGSLPPLLILILGSSAAIASPMNPQCIILNGPFFQGWLVRMVDHEQSSSFVLIIGSFSPANSGIYEDHYIFCGSNNKFGNHFTETFPPCDKVTINGIKQSNSKNFPKSGSSLNITWAADGVGFFKFNENNCQLNFRFNDIHIKANIFGRTEWWNSKNHLEIGPEGLLGYTSLLPCHYFVHTVGSPGTYSIQYSKFRRIEGRGYAHIEGNYGTYFPSSWIWSQGISKDNNASISVAGGRFVIGNISPLNWVIYIRLPTRRLVFRTVQLDKVIYSVNSPSGRIDLLATSIFGNTRAKISITTPENTLHTFSPPLYTPPARGFSNIPGCREHYRAVANVTCYDYDVETGSYQIKESVIFPLTALEFGGEFIGVKMRSSEWVDS